MRRNRDQDLAAHSYYVTLYADKIADLIVWGGDRHALMRCAMMHDLFELATGDIVGPIKPEILDKKKSDAAEIKYIKERFPDERQWLGRMHFDSDICKIIKAADYLDAVMFLAIEAGYGSKWVGRYDDPPDVSVFGNNFHFMCQAWYDLPGVTEMMHGRLHSFLIEVIHNVINEAPKVFLRPVK